MERDPSLPEIPRRFESHPGPPPEMKARVLAALPEAPAPGMPLRRRLALGVLALPGAAVLVIAARHAIFGRSPLRFDLGALPLGPFVAELGLCGALGVAATVVAVRPGRHGLGSAARALAATSVAVAPVYAAIALASPVECDLPAAASSQLHPWGLPCLMVATLIGALALSVLTWSLRRAVPSAARLRGAALGAASGAWAGLALVVHCPSSAPVHLLVGHVLPVAVFAAAGALAAPAFLRP